VSSGALENDANFLSFVNQQPIGFEMTLPPAGVIADQPVIPVDGPMPHSFCETLCLCGRLWKRTNTDRAAPAALECGGMTAKVPARWDLGLQSMLLQADGLTRRRHAAALQGTLRALILSAGSKNYAALGGSLSCAPNFGSVYSL
jgi:hypothetical protein